MGKYTKYGMNMDKGTQKTEISKIVDGALSHKITVKENSTKLLLKILFQYLTV